MLIHCDEMLHSELSITNKSGTWDIIYICSNISSYIYDIDLFFSSWIISHFMEPEFSRTYSQKPDIWPYTEPVEFSPHSHMHFFMLHFNIILLSMHRFPKPSFILRIFNRNVVWIFVSFWVPYAPTIFVFLGVMTLIILSEESKFWNSSRCNFL
jgi:hypothetical protein